MVLIRRRFCKEKKDTVLHSYVYFKINPFYNFVVVETTSDLTSIQNGNGKRQMSSNGRYSFSINRKGLICSNVVLIDSQRN